MGTTSPIQPLESRDLVRPVVETERLAFLNITTSMPVIGFTGALGSGCSYLAKGLAKYSNYVRRALSDTIREIAKARGIEPTVSNLQDIGDELRRTQNRGILVPAALESINKELPSPDSPNRPAGIIIDGIRNVGEIQALQRLPNFYLISVQAELETRRSRLLGPHKRFTKEKDFLAADARDIDEHTEYGQQVQACNDLSDIILINNHHVSESSTRLYKQYVSDFIYHKYVSLIEEVTRSVPAPERKARPEEALMTAAYVVSKRSSCLKRKVGAVIASPDGEIVAAGFNDVPMGSDPCISDDRYGWCARDIKQERAGREIRHCPGCGEIITIQEECRGCKAKINHFSKRCPECGLPLELEYVCPKCQKRVFAEYLAGAGSGKGKLLDLCRALHAEENAILNLSRKGVYLDPREGYVLYSTTFPCHLCANKIASIGIKKVVYAEPYPMEEAKKVFAERAIVMERFQGVKSRAFFRLYS